jgi:hypothetical protein
MSEYKNIFKSRYPELKGKDWIKRIGEEDRKVFIHIGFVHSDYGRLGGKKRASTAKRDYRGRFIKESS